VSGNTLTVVSTVAGIVVGFLTSWWFTQSSKRASQEANVRLHNDNVSLRKEISAMKNLLSGLAESAAKATIPNVEQALQSAGLPDKTAAAVATSLSPAASTSALDVLVRASLGTLLNERGEVSVSRLYQAVADALPDASESSILSSLEELRKAGKISWSGNDIWKAGIIKVHPQ
jgi:hypothetical protein